MSITTDATFSYISVDHNVKINDVELFDLETGKLASFHVPFEYMDLDVASGMVEEVSGNFYNSISANLNNLDIRLTGNVTALESKLGNLTGQVYLLDNITGAVLIELEGNIENLEFQYTFIESSVGNLESSMSIVESNVGNLEIQVTGIESNVGKLDSSLLSFESNRGN